MSKKTKLLPSIFRSKEATNNKQPWQWPSCKHPKTLSFRHDNLVFNAVNSVFLQVPQSSAELRHNINLPEEEGGGDPPPEPPEDVIICGAIRPTDRLFFEPDATGSLLVKEEAKDSNKNIGGDFDGAGVVVPYKQSVALALESDDPYLDFKKSMEEMVEAHGLKEWERLEELLGWYLKVNEKENHGIIVGAFVDVLIGSLASTTSSSSNNASTAATTTPTATTCCSDLSSSYSSADSCFSTPSSPAVSPSGDAPRL